MKKLISLCAVCLLVCSAMAQDQNVNVVVIGGGSSSKGAYVDLGLPSGTLWKRQNEPGFYDYDEAFDRFGSELPERHHFVELQNECTWKWMSGYGYKVIGPNGNSITFPAKGYRYAGLMHEVHKGYYWSATDAPNTCSLCAWYLEGEYMYNYGHKWHELSVRLIKY